jgi:maleylacetate reductase
VYEQVSVVLDRIGARKALLVVGPGRGWLTGRVKSLLGQRSTGSFTDVAAHVPSWEANLAVASAQEVHADAVVALGGGSAAGYAKIVALALRLPWIAMPATLSGAEMTSRYFVTTDVGKESGSSARTAARAVLRDPQALAGVPVRVLASSGMSAVGACLEVLAGGGPATTTAGDALDELWDVLPRLIHRPHDFGLREAALRGAQRAGTALELAGPGPAQIIAEDLGAMHRVDHGALVACLVPAAAAEVDLVPAMAGVGSPAQRVRAFARALGLPTELRAVCQVPDPDAVVSRLAARRDLADLADPQILLALLKESA